MGFWEIVSTVITSVGGIGAIIVFVVKLCSNIIADRLEKKYELKMNKELESYKTALSNKSYISKTRFDAEFSIYRELSAAFFEMDNKIFTMIPFGYTTVPADKEKQEEVDVENYNEAQKAVVYAQGILYKNLPFISEDYISKYEELLNLSGKQLFVFEQRWTKTNLCKDKDVLDLKDYQRSQEIHNKLMELNKEIRGYLNSLDVIE